MTAIYHNRCWHVLWPDAGEPPELRLAQHRDAVSLLAQPLDLHQLQPTVAARRLQRVGPAADDDGRLRRRPRVDDRPGAPRRRGDFVAGLDEDAGEGQVHAAQRAEHARLERPWTGAQRVD